MEVDPRTGAVNEARPSTPQSPRRNTPELPLRAGQLEGSAANLVWDRYETRDAGISQDVVSKGGPSQREHSPNEVDRWQDGILAVELRGQAKAPEQWLMPRQYSRESETERGRRYPSASMSRRSNSVAFAADTAASPSLPIPISSSSKRRRSLRRSQTDDPYMSYRTRRSPSSSAVSSPMERSPGLSNSTLSGSARSFSPFSLPPPRLPSPRLGDPHHFATVAHQLELPKTHKGDKAEAKTEARRVAPASNRLRNNETLLSLSMHSGTHSSVFVHPDHQLPLEWQPTEEQQKAQSMLAETAPVPQSSQSLSSSRASRPGASTTDPAWLTLGKSRATVSSTSTANAGSYNFGAHFESTSRKYTRLSSPESDENSPITSVQATRSPLVSPRGQTSVHLPEDRPFYVRLFEDFSIYTLFSPSRQPTEFPS